MLRPAPAVFAVQRRATVFVLLQRSVSRCWFAGTLVTVLLVAPCCELLMGCSGSVLLVCGCRSFVGFEVIGGLLSEYWCLACLGSIYLLALVL